MNLMLLFLFILIFRWLIEWLPEPPLGKRITGAPSTSSLPTAHPQPIGAPSTVSPPPTPKALILQFRSSPSHDAVLAGEAIRLVWEVVGAAKVFLAFEGKSVQVAHRGEYGCCLTRSQIVQLRAIDPAGLETMKGIDILVFQLPDIDFPIPFPVVKSCIEIQLSPAVIAPIHPPKIEIPTWESGMLRVLGDATHAPSQEVISIDSNTQHAS